MPAVHRRLQKVVQAPVGISPSLPIYSGCLNLKLQCEDLNSRDGLPLGILEISMLSSDISFQDLGAAHLGHPCFAGFASAPRGNRLCF